MEESADNILAQNVCSHFNGNSIAQDATKEVISVNCGLFICFCLSSPVGVGIGIAIDATTQGQTTNWIYAISMGIACGVFVYVAINHLMAKGYTPQSECYFDTSFYKFFALLLGVTVLAIVVFWDT